MPSLVRFSHCLLLSLLALSLVRGEPRVHISISPVVQAQWGERMHVTCIVSGLTDSDYFKFKVSFNCPLVKGVPCLQNCKQTCQPGAGCTRNQTKLVSAIGCEVYTGSDKLQFDYEFAYNSEAYAGKYSCLFYGRMSPPVNIPPPIRPPTRKTTVKELETTTRPTTRTSIRTRATPRPSQPPTYSAVECTPVSTAAPVLDLHRERIVVTVVVLLIISAAFNVVVCVRCALLSHYARHPNKRRMSTLLCMATPPATPHPPHHGSILYAPSLGPALADDAGGSDSTYSMPTSQVAYQAPIMGHGRASTLPVIPGADSQNVVFIPVIASSLNTLQSASHPRLNSPLPDNISVGGHGARGGAGGGAGGSATIHQPPNVPLREHTRDGLRDSRRLSASSAHMRAAKPVNGGVVREDEEMHPESETLID